MTLVSHLPWLRIGAALVGWVVVPGSAGAPGGSSVPLELVSTAGIASGYRLPVVPVAPAPSFTSTARALEAPRQLECPAVTAVVVAEDAVDSFAMVDGALVRAGSRVRAGERAAEVTRIESGVVELRVGSGALRCELE